jgi:succinate dehydrogenase/fumarate reductase flavoprotein subunit
LLESLKDEANDMVFLKGYQWPFDTRKVDGSSRVDILVHREICDGNRVYMDFRSNPSGLDFDKLMPETYDYLKKSDAMFGTPIERLEKMNPQAIELYMNNGIDIRSEMLEVAVCSQHCNGGISVDANWESSVKGLYVAGEAAGVFGVYRPGGSALNDTQVGSMRAAEHIVYKKEKQQKLEDPLFTPPQQAKGGSSYVAALKKAQHDMSMYAAFQRDAGQLRRLADELTQVYETIEVPSRNELPDFYKCKDLLLTQINMLSAMICSAEAFGSRGSALVSGSSGADDMEKVVMTHAGKSSIEPVRAIPEGGGWFENVWREYIAYHTRSL